MSQVRFLTLVGTFLLLSGLTFVAVRATSVSNDAALAAESGTKEGVPKKNTEDKLQKAIFAAGCFWHVEDAFRHVKGVADVTSGYTGGNFKNPSYQDVCSGQTHHAEAVEVLYDPAKVTYGELLNTFWEIHDPTTLNAQGPDHGEQYRSAIFFVTPEQKALATASRDKLAASGKEKNPIVTQILPAGDFYRAEEYHQHYYEKHGAVGCAVPKRK
jgi:peptide-methionine (S)-S-oxide reductase